MNYPRYDVQESVSRLHFEFTSEGPKGKILKVVDYAYINELRIWNLGFGDYDPDSGLIDDNVVSNNGDGRKVLSTVIYTLNEFFAKHAEAIVFFTGSNDLRTAIYGRIIRQNIHFVKNRFIIEGVDEEGNTELFNSSKPYVAFLISLQDK